MSARYRHLAVLIDAALILLIGSTVRVLTLGVMARANGEDLTGLLHKWDAQYYLAIAEYGYFDAPLATDVPVHHRTLAFFPGFPLLVRGVGAVTGLETAAAAALVNIIAGVAMTAAAMVIARRMGADRFGMAAVGVLVSAAPMSITFTMPYTEALFGALAFWALLALMDRRWGWAAGLILVLGVVRITAVVLIVVFVVAVLIRAPRDPRAWACLALTPWSLAAYLGWASWHTRDVGGYFGIQAQGWHTGFDFGAATFAWSVEILTTGTEVGYLLSLAVMLAAVIALALAWGRVPAEVWTFCAAVMAMVLLSDGIMHSRPRLLLPAVLVLIPWALRCADRLPRWGTGLLAGAWIALGAWFSGYMLAVFEWAI
ncbi:MAG: hypothetical protein Q4G50_00520 [Corynebacterium sp.]|uniref:hypothetical protein n=1 Tax=Corynebacterium sp. TaxID=1720 RepID=UPI0026E02FC9|nr:hypothetical protein [Corynebacterium sp.]MDO5668466.1 hypothetical protein [Corynebacterium sp.]